MPEERPCHSETRRSALPRCVVIFWLQYTPALYCESRTSCENAISGRVPQCSCRDRAPCIRLYEIPSSRNRVPGNFPIQTILRVCLGRDLGRDGGARPRKPRTQHTRKHAPMPRVSPVNLRYRKNTWNHFILLTCILFIYSYVRACRCTRAQKKFALLHTRRARDAPGGRSRHVHAGSEHVTRLNGSSTRYRSN